MDKTPEELAQERQAALRAASGVPPSPPPPPQPTNQPPTRWATVNLEEAAQNARTIDREQPMRAMATDQENAWETRERVLLETDPTGTPTPVINRSIDMETATEYGPSSRQAIAVINKYFAKAECSELHFNAPDKIFAKVNGQRVQVKAEFSSEEEYNHFIEDLIKRADTFKTFDDIKRRARDVVRMSGGDRMAIVMPPLTDTIQVAIHKIVARTWDMNKLIQNQTMLPEMAAFLQSAVRAKANILICGEMGAGKSVMLSLLAQQIGANERVVLIEEVPEIFLDKPDVSRVTYYPSTTSDVPMGLNEVLDTVLYMRMDRVIVGEIHEKGMYLMLRTMATGADGSMSTFHAGSVEQALEQVRNHIIMEHGSIPSKVASHFIRQALNLVVVVERVGDKHRVVEVAEVEWRSLSENSDTIGRNLLFRFDRKTSEFIKVGRLDEKGKIAEKARKYGVPMDPAWFAGESYGQRDRGGGR